MTLQPIETARKDGTFILTYTGDDRTAQFSVSYWCDYDNRWYTDFRQRGVLEEVYASYWMPLPEPPTKEMNEHD